MRHKSQNRVFGQTFVYLMGNFPYFMLNKFGITDHQKARTKGVSDTTPGTAYTLLSVNLPYGYNLEQFVHRLYGWLNFRFWRGSGRTEWFIVFSPIVGTLALLADAKFDLGLSNTQLKLCFFTPFIWWDGVLWLIIFRASKFLIVIGAIIFLVYTVALFA